MNLYKSRTQFKMQATSSNSGFGIDEAWFEVLGPGAWMQACSLWEPRMFYHASCGEGMRPCAHAGLTQGEARSYAALGALGQRRRSPACLSMQSENEKGTSHSLSL